MSCKVWIWNYQGTKTAFGHASMEVYGGDPHGTYYISWWPNCSAAGGKKEEYFGMCEPKRSRTFAKDIESEFDNRPDRHVLLDGLDDTKMKVFWDDLTTDHRAKWSASTTNCAAVVMTALRAGGADRYFSFFDDVVFDVFHTNWWTWTPDSAHSYAVELAKKLREAGKMP